MPNPSDPGYYTTGRKAAPSWPVTEPIPEVLSTDPVTMPKPGPVLSLCAAGMEAGWTVRVGYSRGPARAVKVGTYKLVETFGVWAGPHPDTGWRWCAMYERTVGKVWKWPRVTIWRPTEHTRFTHATVTDLREFLAVRGSVGAAWFKAVHARVADQAERDRAAARNRPAKAKEGAS